MKVSVIIPAYNAENTLAATLESLENQTYPKENYEIIVVDDGSTDKTAEIAKSYNVRYIYQKNAGPASARNKGVQFANGEIILFTDSDCVPESNWISELVRPFSDPEVAAAKGRYLTKQKERIANFAQLEFEERYRKLLNYKYIDFVDSYSAAFRKSVFLSVGGFDQQFTVANNEDVELSYKLVSKGYKMLFVPEAIVYHLHPNNIKDYLKVKFWRAYYRMQVYRKYPTKIFRDTYTPTSLKLQLVFAAIMAILLAFSVIQLLLRSSAIVFSLYCLLFSLFCFFLSALPLSFYAWRREKALGIITPLLLIARAYVFLCGIIYGTWAFFLSREKFYSFTKRIFDLILSTLLLTMLAPFLILIGLLIKLDSSGPIIYKQKRMGKNGVYFTFYKFRTMVKNAENMKDQYRSLSALKGPVFKLKDDPRVTRIGKLLRRFSLDELPQIFNIIMGDMSFVGPRPLPEEDIKHPEMLNPQGEIKEEQIKEWLKARHKVVPGLTGLWQVSGRSDLPLEGWLKYDMEYLEKRSFWFDLKILFKTIPVVLLGKGAR